MPNKKVEVWDANGIKRTVSPVDAKEILSNGGSDTEPQPESEKKTKAKKSSGESENTNGSND